MRTKKSAALALSNTANAVTALVTRLPLAIIDAGLVLEIAARTIGLNVVAQGAAASFNGGSER